jgi:glycosyltransferase involved in cell wall biosynthesis
MNPFQGIFHYKQDEITNSAIARLIDRQVIKLKTKSIRSRKKDLTLVAPSKWLLKAATQSKVFKNVTGCYIPYPLDMEIFNPKYNYSLKNSLNILPDQTVFLFVAQKTDNLRKGFDLLIDALKKINQKKITLLVIGNSDSLALNDSQVIFLGTIVDEQKLSTYYSIADAFIIPSREDNLPNVMLESLACGTPIISFDLGGMAEIIENDFNGLKAKIVESKELTNVLNEFIKTKGNFSRDIIRNFALENFSEDSIAKKYEDTYKQLLKRDT